MAGSNGNAGEGRHPPGVRRRLGVWCWRPPQWQYPIRSRPLKNALCEAGQWERGGR
jgi:hypothetical protein